MSKFTLEINTDHRAFENLDELPRILRELADDASEGLPDAGIIRDSNGNAVGKFTDQVD